MKEMTRKQSETGHIKNVTNDVKEDIDLLWEEAKAKGYPSVLEYVKSRYQVFDRSVKKEVLNEIYQTFLTAVQHKEDKAPWGRGQWDSHSTFLEYLSYSSKEAASRLDELDWKLKTQYPSFAGMIKMLPSMTNVPHGIGQGMSKEDYEFYELVLRKTKELIDECLKTPEIINDLLPVNDDLIRKIKHAMEE